MEVKVGQVWQHNETEDILTVIDITEDLVMIIGNDKEVCRDYMFKFRDGFYSIVSDAPPSDLEIVQKALAKTGFVIWMNSKDFSVCDDNRGEVVIEFGSFESLLTWAKQTIEGE